MATSPAELAVHELTQDLRPADGDYWITFPTPGRYSLIAPVTGQLVWLHLVTARAVLAAEAADLIVIARVQPMPEYRGGGRHRWRAGLYGHVVELADR